VGGTLFSLKKKGLKEVKTNKTKNSLKAGTREFFHEARVEFSSNTSLNVYCVV
jgi:hypothetical protein